MYIRAVQTASDQTRTAFTNHLLVESLRSGKSPRQRLVMHLGPLDLPRPRWRELAPDPGGCGVTGQAVLFPPEPDIAALAEKLLRQREIRLRRNPIPQPAQEEAEDTLVKVDLASMETSTSRSLGPELVGHAFYQRLGFPEMLSACGLDLYHRQLAEAVIVGRLVAPDSDLGTWNWLRSQTSLPELQRSQLEGAGKDVIYEIADRLWCHHIHLEAGLRKREEALFPRGQTVVLYDLTNIHLEGRSLGNALAKRGHSKQKRSDCPFVTLASPPRPIWP